MSASNKQNTVIWKASPEDFAKWMEGWLGRNPVVFEFVDGYCVAGPVRLERRPTYMGRDVVSVGGAIYKQTGGTIEYIDPDTGGRKTVAGSYLHDCDVTVARCAIVVNPDGTIEITPELCESRAAAYLEALVGELNRWAVLSAKGTLDPAVDTQFEADATRAKTAPAPDQAKQRKGGPEPTPDEQKLQVVLGWEEVRGREPQESYCNRVGVAPSTLRSWKQKLRAEGKLAAN